MDNSRNKFSCMGITSSSLIQKITLLIEHRISKDDKERHVDMISNFIEMSQYGFLVPDLPFVTQLMEVLSQSLHEDNVYEKSLEQLLYICSIPPSLTKSSDVLTFAIDLQELFSVLGFLLVCLRNYKLRNRAVDALQNLMTEIGKPKWFTSLEVRKNAADNSRLPEILGQLLAIADEELYPELLSLISLIIDDRKEARKVILQQDALNSLFRRIEPTWRKRLPNIRPESPPTDRNVPYFEETIVIIWELLKYLEEHREDLATVKIIDRFSMWNIQNAFHVFITSANRKVDVNSIIALKIKLMDLFPEGDFTESGLSEVFVNMSCDKVFPPKPISDNTAKIFSTEDDYIFTKLVLLAIPLVIKFDGGRRILEDSRIIHRLLKTIFRSGFYFSQSDSCVVQIFCWNVLKKLVPYLENEFIENSGPSMLMDCIKECELIENGLVILVKCLDTACYILKNDHNKLICNSILYNNGLKILLELSEKILSQPALDSQLQTCAKMVFCILNKLCQSCPDELQDDLVEISIKYIKRFLAPHPEETIFDNVTLVYLIDFIWDTIINCAPLSITFIQRGGVYLMLDIIQRFPFSIQMFTLGALVDLCEDEKCVPYLMTWSGLRKVKTGRNGQISETAFPIIGREQWKQTFYRSKCVNSHPVIYDLYLSCRPKIYALLKLLNERHREVFEIADEEYKVSYEDLPAKDQVTMLLADNFLALKLGEAWVELQVEFNTVKFQPLPSDKKVISSLVTRYHKWGEFLRKTQLEILEEALVDELVEEQKLYNSLAESRIKEALEALEELRYIARCTERMFRISQKYQQQQHIERSLRRIPCGPSLHRTYLSALQVTPVFNHNILVKGGLDLTLHEIPINPVSPKESELQFLPELPEDLLKSGENIDQIIR
ncbi:hypothetical protein JTB14_019415 [Gonioctena quinquepunctata]|nr:hypothetical protein JTB14_019415 [Gonioctena quinquepunctata]